jgi:putative Mn2+ efflux pump MntP
VAIWYPAVVIGVITALLSYAGIYLGNRLGEKFGKRMEIVGGIILIGIGLRVLLSHLLAPT